MNNKYGTVTVENIQEFAELILNKLQGKKYTFASHNGYFYPDSPAFLDVRTNQELENGKNGSPLSVYYDKNGNYAGFNFCDTYGVWGTSTSKKDGNEYDPTYNFPYISIDWNDIRIIHRAGSGALLVWLISIQE